MPGENVVHIIDDDEAVRDSISFLLTAAKMVVETHESAVEFLRVVPRLASGCIVTDIRMSELSGLDLIRRLRERGVKIPVIVITGHGDVPLAVEAMKLGAADFIEKPFDDETLLAAIRSALDRTRDEGQREAREVEIRLKVVSLSDRERQVLEGLVAGHANKIMAHDLGISPRTVEIYRANVMTKMQAGSLSELVRMALIAGPLKEPG
jgi:two-component system response regulator FixJ